MNINNYSQTVHLGSYAELQALAASGTLQRGHLYQATDGAGQRLFFAVTSASLQEIKPSVNYVQTVESTGAIPLTVDANGHLTATFAPSADAGNALSVGTDGKPLVIVPASFVVSVGSSDAITTSVDAQGKLISSLIVDGTRADQALEVTATGAYVPKLKVAAGSANRASITNNELTIVAPRITEVHQDTTATSLADFVARYNAGTWVPSTPIRKGDIFMVGPLGTENYIYNGFEGNPTVLAQEFLAVEGLDYTADQIRNLVSAGNSLTYNVNTGKFDVVISGMSTNDLSLDFENKLFLQVAYANVGTVDETGTAKTNTLTALLQDIYTKLGNTITSSTTDANNGITKNGNVVGLGGSLNANTTVSMGAHKLAFTGNEVSVEQLMLGAYTTDANGAIVASAGVRRIFIDVTNGMLSYIPN